VLVKSDPQFEVAITDYGTTFVDYDAPLAVWTKAFCDTLASFRMESEIVTALSEFPQCCSLKLPRSRG
jgi:hypothetical protein